MKPHLYKLVGSAYIVLSTPAVFFLIAGKLMEVNVFYTIALGGVPLGMIFMLFGYDKYCLNRFSKTGLKLAMVALLGNIPLLAAFMFLDSGFQIFRIATNFSMIFIVFASLLAFFFTLLAIVRGNHCLPEVKVRAGSANMS